MSTIILEKFNKSQNALVLQQSDLSLQSISDMVDKGAIDISPKYQRRERWTLEKESELIESFLLNIPVPPIYLAEDEYGIYSVIDGKQRVTAIHKFLNEKFKLSGLQKFKELEGASFKELPNSLSNALRIRPYLRVVTLLRQSDPDLKHEVFLRLNKAGVALNSQEIRNVAFRGAFNDMLFELSQLEFLVAQLKSSKASKVYREMIDIQYVLRFFTVRDSWTNFPGNMDIAMDRFMAKHYKDSNANVAKHSKDFTLALDFCEKIWGPDSFMKPGGNARILQGFFDIQMVCSSLLTNLERGKCIKKKAEVKKALTNLMKMDSTFTSSITEFTSNQANVKYRIQTFLKILRAI